MSVRSLPRIINMALRGLTLASKFLLIFFLARFLEPKDLGLYGLLVAAITYALYLLGMDFYTYSTREILRLERGEWGSLLRSQGALTLLLYLVFVPLLFLLFATNILPWHFAGFFMILIILEHFAQELMRLLIAVSEPLVASWVLFLRSGAWVVVAVPLMYCFHELRSLDVVLIAWSLGGVGAVILGIVRLTRLGLGGWHVRADWAWIRRGIKVAFPLLCATLAIRAIYTLDRYWLEALAGLEVLGAYVLFIGLANALMSFLDAGVFSFSYPRLIMAFQRKNSSAYRKELQRLLVLTVGAAVLFSCIALVTVQPLLQWLGKGIYFEYQEMFPWILMATVIYGLGMVPHYALYSQNQDRPIIHSHLLSLVVFVSTTWLFSDQWPDMAVPLGMCLAFLLMLLWKSYAYIRLTPKPYRALML